MERSRKFIKPKADVTTDGLYISVKICGVNVNCLIDTGATSTVLHPTKYLDIPSRDRPRLEKRRYNIQVADGSVVTPLGSIEAILEINGKLVKHSTLVADIDAPAVIGYDFLHAHDCQIDMGGGSLLFAGEKLKCQRESRMESIFRVTIHENVVVPPDCEMIVMADIQGKTQGGDSVLVESNMVRMDAEGIRAARAVVKPEDGVIPIRMINTNKEPKQLYKGTCAAYGEQVTVGTQHGKAYGDDRINSLKETNELPAHLEDMFNRCREQVEPDKHEAIKNLLIAYQDDFAKSKNDLGRTNLVQHRVDTGTAPPVKQRPRRLALSKREAAAKEVDRMLENGIIEPSTSAWASPVVLGVKAGEHLALCA
ncbi:uncharacterized protein LOC117318986 [Pecten maximus]|uniref:uncharacterized protein LOC117318986 n=1 Tax=Pecten maximus TaxID=6579 RepID=UPI00145859B7|nr:uncharacterized protein LOC117318986 [Pecten maximus]